MNRRQILKSLASLPLVIPLVVDKLKNENSLRASGGAFKSDEVPVLTGRDQGRDDSYTVIAHVDVDDKSYYIPLPLVQLMKDYYNQDSSAFWEQSRISEPSSIKDIGREIFTHLMIDCYNQDPSLFFEIVNSRIKRKTVERKTMENRR